MSQDDILAERVRAFITNLPKSEMNPDSRALLHQDPLEWVASKARLVRAAILVNDLEGLELLKQDIGHVTGLNEAQWWILGIMEKMVAETNHPD